MNNCLILISCNGGAKDGDYLIPQNSRLGTLWKYFYKRFSHVCDFVAVDSIITFKNNDGLGALVKYPEEMSRVKGFDVHATLENCNPGRPIGIKRLEEHTECLKIGIQRLFPKYNKVFVALNTEVYKMCAYAALNETEQWYKTVFYDQLSAAFDRTKVGNEIEADLKTWTTTGIKTIPPRSTIEKKYIDRWTRYRLKVPNRWRYWDH